MTACTLTLADLVGYARGEPVGEPDAVEAHVFACDACLHRLAWLEALADALPVALARRGGVDVVLTAGLVERLAAAGVVMRQYRPAPGEAVACTVAATDDLAVNWIPVAPAPDERVDLTVTTADGTLAHVIEDAPVDVASGCVIFARAAEGLMPLPAIELRVRALGVGPAGTRTLADHVFRHTPPPRASA